MLLAPVAAMLVQMAISRSREYEADRVGAEICRDPRPLASALQKLQQGAMTIDNQAAENNPATAHLFIVNPLHKGGVDHLFSTHPNMDNRIARLMAMQDLMGVRPDEKDLFSTKSSHTTLGKDQTSKARASKGSVPNSGSRRNSDASFE